MSNRFFDLEQELSQAKEVAQQGFSEARSVSADPSRNQLLTLAQHLKQVRSDIAESLRLAPLGQQFGDYDPILDGSNDEKHPRMAVQMGLIGIIAVTPELEKLLYTIAKRCDQSSTLTTTIQAREMEEISKRLPPNKSLLLGATSCQRIPSKETSRIAFTIENDIYFFIWDINNKKLEIHDGNFSIESLSPIVATSPITTTTTQHQNYVVPNKLKITKGKIFDMVSHWYRAAMTVVEEEVGKEKLAALSPGPKFQDLQNLYEGWVRIFKYPEVQLSEKDDYVSPKRYNEYFKLDPLQLAAQVTAALSKADITKLKATPNLSFRKAIAIAFIRNANKDSQSWDTIDTKMWDQNGIACFSSILTPINEKFHVTYHLRDGIKKYGQTGITSMNERIPVEVRSLEESNRTANFWHSELYKGNRAKPLQEKLFSAFRSGAFSAYGEKDLTKRRIANKARASGVIEAMVIQKLKDLDKQLAGSISEYLDSKLITNPKTPFVLPINIVSIDLLSDTEGIGSQKGDAEMVEDHHEALRALDGQVHPIDVKWLSHSGSLENKQVYVLTNILDFNIATNQFASLTQDAQNVNNASSMWRLGQAVENARINFQAEINSLKKLGATKQELQQSIETINSIERKVKQILLLWNDIQLAKNAKEGDQGNFVYPAKLANLAYLLGYMVHFNCKSGKDRTGLMDVECKFLARELAIQRENNSPFKDLPEVSLTSDNKYRHQQMVWESGNLQILERNTRGQSLKVADLALNPILGKVPISDTNLMKRLGEKDMLLELRGLAEYTVLVDKMLE